MKIITKKNEEYYIGAVVLGNNIDQGIRENRENFFEVDYILYAMLFIFIKWHYRLQLY